MPPWVRPKIEQALGAGWRVHEIRTPSDGSGDGAGSVHPEVLEAVTDAEIYMGYGIPEALLEAGSELQWVHSGAAGVFGSLTPAMLPPPAPMV